LANNIIQHKRTSTSGRTPNTTNSSNSQYIAAGEFALNMADQILYTSDGTNLIIVGATQSNATVNNHFVTSSLTVGNAAIGTNSAVNINSTAVVVGNSTVNGSISTNSSVAYFTGTSYNALNANNASNLGGIAAASYQLNSTLNANIASYLPNYNGVVNGFSFTVGTTFTANNSGVWTGSTTDTTTGTGASILTDASLFIGNNASNASINSSALSIGGNVIANSTGANNAFNLGGYTFASPSTIGSTTANAGTFTSLTSANLTTTSNTVNVGTAVVITATGNVGIGNNAPTNKLSVNGTSYLQGNVQFTQGIIDSTGSQGTAGWVLASNGAGNVYWTSSAGTNVAAQYAWTNTQSFSNAITFNSTANLTFNTGAKIIDSTGSQGLVGQVLTSNGVGNVYWSSVSSGGVNTANQYVFTNTITFNANLSVNGAIFLGGSNGQVGQVLTSNGTGNAYWSTVSGGGSFTNGASITVSNIAYSNATGTSVGVAYQFINTVSGSLDTVFS